jgi:regulator of RNase E activity RraA
MVIAGRAMPVLEADYVVSQEEGKSGWAKQPFGLMFDALDDLKPHEVYLATGASARFALWGELMSVRAMQLQAAGAVLDGYSRDTRGILNLNFPTFSRGRYAQDQGVRGKVIDYRIAVEIDSIRIQPGDIIFADLDGVLVVPRQVEAEAISQALEKVRQENLVRKALESGMGAGAAFKQFGVM